MVGLIVLILLALNHSLQLYLQHNTVANDAAIGIGYLMYLFL